MSRAGMEPCILSLSLRAPSEFLTRVLTKLRTTVSPAPLSISHCVARSAGGKVGRGVSGSGKHFFFLFLLLWLWSSAPPFDLFFSFSTSLYLPVSSSRQFSFLSPSFRWLLHPMRRKRKIDLYFSVFFSCCHQKYKTSENSYSHLFLSFLVCSFASCLLNVQTKKAHHSWFLPLIPFTLFFFFKLTWCAE